MKMLAKIAADGSTELVFSQEGSQNEDQAGSRIASNIFTEYLKMLGRSGPKRASSISGVARVNNIVQVKYRSRGMAEKSIRAMVKRLENIHGIRCPVDYVVAKQ